MDVLGFAKSVEKDAAQLFETYRNVRRRLVERAQTFAVVSEKMGEPEERGRVVSALDRINGMVFFSDSFFIFGVDNSDETHEQVCDFSRIAFRTFFEQGLPSKGAVDSGPIWADFKRSIFLGIGINRAYRLCESLDHIGIVVRPPSSPRSYLSAPLRVPSKVGAPVSLTVPRHVFRSGIGEREIDWVPIWDRLVQGVRDELDMHALGKYEASRPIVEVLMTNGWSTGVERVAR
jgi:hypothetical protein